MYETLIYPATITEEGGTFNVTFRDLEGCYTFGDSYEEALAMAQDALDGYLEASIEQACQVSRPSDVQQNEEALSPAIEIAVPLLLRFYREDNKKSINQMAIAMNLAYQNYQSLESGKRKNLTISTIKKAFAALGYMPQLILKQV